MTLLGDLNTLESAGLVRIAQLEPDLEYLFRHALVREAAYASILSVDQKKLHLEVGEAIELLYPDRLSEYAAMLSHHYGEAGDAEKALKYCTLAGESALAAYANQEAENHFRCGLGLVNEDSKKAKLLHLLGEALYRQSRYDETLKTWYEGIQSYQQLGEDDEVARLYARSARAAWHGGDQPEGLRLSQEGLAAVEGMADSPAKAMLIHEAARAYHFNGFPDEAEPLCRQALEMAERLNAPEIQADALTTLGVLPGIQTAEAISSLERAVELAESNNQLEIATRANHNLGVVTGEHYGDQATARKFYYRAAEIARQRGSRQEEMFSLFGAAGVSIGLGEIITAQQIVNDISEIKSTFSDPNQGHLEFESVKFGLHFLNGELQVALETSSAARKYARQIGDLQTLYNFCANIADVYLVLDRIEKINDWSEAEDAALEGIEIGRRGVASPVRSLCQLSSIYIQQGKLDEAKKLYADARQNAGVSPSYWQEQSLLENKRDLAAAEGRWSDALESAEQLSKRLAQVDLRFPWAFSLLVWAEIYTARGEPNDLERARVIYREAQALLVEFGADYYVNIIEERLRALSAKSFAATQALDEVTQELAQAGRIQEGFFPEEIPEIAGWQISAVLHPARQTSGDFYDFIQLPENRIGFVVADVADKGMGAALYMATCRTLIRTFAGEHPNEPRRALEKANRRILADTHGGLFITVFYGVLEPTSGRMVYCNAGHNPPFVFSPDRTSNHQALLRTGMPLGIVKEASWEQEEIAIEQGAVLVAYTDGVTENQNAQEEFYEEARLVAVVKTNVRHSTKDLLAEVEKDIEGFSGKGGQFDDITLMIIKRELGAEQEKKR